MSSRLACQAVQGRARAIQWSLKWWPRGLSDPPIGPCHCSLTRNSPPENRGSFTAFSALDPLPSRKPSYCYLLLQLLRRMKSGQPPACGIFVLIHPPCFDLLTTTPLQSSSTPWQRYNLFSQFQPFNQESSPAPILQQ